MTIADPRITFQVSDQELALLHWELQQKRIEDRKYTMSRLIRDRLRIPEIKKRFVKNELDYPQEDR
ncbi:hypothetical protein KGP36_01815 [Patescibacteria group bacterium]|nr:hypothetical protein [Patescibacteria group bacterium]